jgi:hypothetical protein
MAVRVRRQRLHPFEDGLRDLRRRGIEGGSWMYRF